MSDKRAANLDSLGWVAVLLVVAAVSWYFCLKPTALVLEMIMDPLLYGAPAEWFVSVVALVPALVLLTAVFWVARRIRNALTITHSIGTFDIAEARDSLDDAIQGVVNEHDFTSLWKESQERLKYYHEIAMDQSRRSFRAGQLAAILGLAAVLAIGWFAVQADTATAAAAAAALGASAAALSGYIGATFVKTQIIATEQLRSYFAQASDSWRFLSSERLLDQVKDPAARDAAAAALVRDVSSQPATATSPNPNP